MPDIFKHSICIFSMAYEFARRRTDMISRATISTELIAVADKLGFREFTCREFDTLATISHQVVLREFTDWQKAMLFVRQQLAARNIHLTQRPQTRRKDFLSAEVIFAEMERIWKLCGQRPSQNEWDSSHPAISYVTIRKHFNGWGNACLQFINYKNNSPSPTLPRSEHPSPEAQTVHKPAQILSRTIPLKLRLKVLDRDQFRCIFCGRSPATDIGVRLHIDHIIPISRGGHTTLSNLQTLCFACNLGKGNSLSKTHNVRA